MNKIEQFLETRDHIDKTEFDVVVRNLVEPVSYTHLTLPTIYSV